MPAHLRHRRTARSLDRHERRHHVRVDDARQPADALLLLQFRPRGEISASATTAAVVRLDLESKSYVGKVARISARNVLM